MDKKMRMGLQIRFNSEAEHDIVEFFSTLKKSEVHITAISAFRAYMRVIGFYDKHRLETGRSADLVEKQEVPNPSRTGKKAGAESKGLVDEEAFRALDSMFDNENELLGQSR